MKTFFSALILLSTAHAQACPKLSGEYWCVTQSGNQEPKLETLSVKQWQATDPAEAGITYYSVDWSSIPGAADVFRANAVGVADEYGWITRCSGEKLISVTANFSMMSEMYLDKNGHFVRATNQVVVQNCAPKKKSL